MLLLLLLLLLPSPVFDRVTQATTDLPLGARRYRERARKLERVGTLF